MMSIIQNTHIHTHTYIYICRRRESDPTVDAPDLEFDYDDTDTYFHELAELYSYSEVPEFETTKELFEARLEETFHTIDWFKLSESDKKAYIMGLLDQFEVIKPQDRIAAVKSLLYLALGNYGPAKEEAELERNTRENIFRFLEMGVYEAAIELLSLEMEQGKGVYEGSKSNITIADNHNLRVCLSLLYVIVETVCREDPQDPPEWVEMKKTFLQELQEPVVGDETLTSLLFVMLLGFCNGSMPHYPIKKILLLIWKTILAMMGGVKELAELKKKARTCVKLPPTFPETQAVRPLILPTAAYDPRGNVSNPRQLGRPLSFASEADSIGETCVGGKTLEFRPKARKKDVETYVESCRTKFGCFETGSSGEDLTGLPEPIQESIQVLQDHIYIPLSDVHIAQEEELEKQRALSFGKGVNLPERSSPTEELYKTLLPNLPQYMIALLKVLLAAAPTSRTRNDSLNILVDVLPPEQPANYAESTQVSLDMNRHKEIIVKAISATLLLLLKHFKVNHVYQFEYMSQHLVFANCIPLVLKFFNQNVMQYVAARNNFSALNFPSCVQYPQDIDTCSDVVETSTTDAGFCWRNLFSCINLVRILQKLTKWKHFRTVMLVVFRSAPILKRALKVRHTMMQLYILKLLKVQTKYLGRNWRRSNMKTISAIYRRVRHHLHDDWAYGNDLDAKPWDFQQQEFALKASIENFNAMYYLTEDQQSSEPFAGSLAPLDCNHLSVLGQEVELSDTWKKKYEEWVEVEVFLMPKNWDRILQSPSAFLEAKAMEL